MTAVCPSGGPSEIIPGTQELQNLTAATIIDILTTGEMSWIAPVASGIGYLAYDLTNLCTTDPPAFPTISAARVFSYTNPLDPTGAENLREDVTALIGRFLWYSYCQCVTGSPSAIGTPPGAPSGQQTDGPGAAGPPTATACGSNDVFETKSFDGSGNITWDFTPTSPTFPTTAQWMSFTQSGGISSGTPPYPVTHTLQFQNASSAVLGTFTWTQNADIAFANSLQFTQVIPAGATKVAVLSHTDHASPPSFGMDWEASYFCTATPTSLFEPCCPPDPTLQNLIIQVLQNENSIIDLLDTVLASIPVRAAGYVAGSAHSSLSGNGSISIASSAIAVQVSFTSLPSSYGEQLGSPNTYFDIGFVSFASMEGPLSGIRLSRSVQVISVPEAVSAVDYTFPPGAVVTITELEAA